MRLEKALWRLTFVESRPGGSQATSRRQGCLRSSWAVPVYLEWKGENEKDGKLIIDHVLSR